MKKLVIVESPTKARTIQQFIGKEYNVLSSFGHVRDLPKSKLGVDTEKNFEPSYVIPTKAKKTVSLLKKESAKTDQVILATDEDREGESIAWHLAQTLGLKSPERIVFHEITKQAIQEALQNPRKIDQNLVEAQQGRRILDRLVGYKLSPFLWRKVARRLSAGRVQSVAVRLVVDREREIEKFKAEEYWSVEALFEKENKEFGAQLSQKDGKPLGKLDIHSKQEADQILKELGGAIYTVASIEKKETRKNPLPPFTTSTLQQTAASRLGFPARLTMSVAQQLYEQGRITYHRTDSLNLAQSALAGAKELISKEYGQAYWAGSFRQFKTKSKGAQEAHEAIRPTDPDRKPGTLRLTPQQTKLYQLIWQRFIASQMAQAVFDATSIDIQANQYTFRATGQMLKFPGFLKAYSMKFEEMDLPAIEKGETLKLQKLLEQQHFTQPPPRYNEASLIKMLEQHGIGRPSTYAPILSTIQDRNYVEKDDQRRLRPTEIGIAVNDLLVEHFPEIVDIDFTAEMEEDLDKIAEGKKEWQPMIKEFYGPFAKNLEKKEAEVSRRTIAVEKTDKICPECGKALLIRFGRYGKFFACSGFPECKYTASLGENTIDVPCPKCKKGQLEAKRTKRKKIFYGCNQYPACDFALWDKPTGEKCKTCNALLVETARKKVKCSNSTCPTNQK
ncbi:MAG: type I DNA topoisomerase [Candidatus Wildermuthbacteria bacterium]|nr:type I DNA topoisomerase [Candidatus Wildermuthbacteria bacterium]